MAVTVTVSVTVTLRYSNYDLLKLGYWNLTGIVVHGLIFALFLLVSVPNASLFERSRSGRCYNVYCLFFSVENGKTTPYDAARR
jgi:hypothetical protein